MLNFNFFSIFLDPFTYCRVPFDSVSCLSIIVTRQKLTDAIIIFLFGNILCIKNRVWMKRLSQSWIVTYWNQDGGVCDEGHRGDEDFICVRPLRRKDCFKEKWIVENISGTKTPKIYGARRTLLSESGKVLLKFKKHWTMKKNNRHYFPKYNWLVWEE